jgi:hypothetical protein
LATATLISVTSGAATSSVCAHHVEYAAPPRDATISASPGA